MVKMEVLVVVEVVLAAAVMEVQVFMMLVKL
jgi:hypothetical protein